MKTTIDWTFGNFTVMVELSAAVEGAAAAAVLRHCGLNLLQRTPAGAVEKRLAGDAWPKGAKGDRVRPKGFERDSIAYSDDNAVIVKEGFTLEIDIAPDGEPAVMLQCHCVEVGEYIKGEGVDSKFTDEREILARHEKVGDTTKWGREKVEFEGTMFDEEDAPTVEFLRAIRKLKLAILRANKAGI